MRIAFPDGPTSPEMETSEGGVVLDKKTDGAVEIISSRATNKTTPITDHLVVCRSGTAADTQRISDRVNSVHKAYMLLRMLENEPLYALPIGGFVTGQKSTAPSSGSTFVQIPPWTIRHFEYGWRKISAFVLELLRDNQVLIIAGDTGCGKSTQVH